MITGTSPINLTFDFATGSATGQHIAHFAQHLPPTVQLQPSDHTDELFDSIRAFRRQLQVANLLEPILLDLTWPPEQWPTPSGSVDVLYCSNVVHITPWQCSVGLFEGAGRVLVPSTGLLVIYGPFAVDGRLEPQSNVDFDRSLRHRNPQWGVRDTRDLTRLAGENGLEWQGMTEMPANNRVIYFRKK